MVWVMRLWSPPWLLTTLLIIHEVAEPHTMSMRRFMLTPVVFQKCPSALTKPEFWVSKHGNSSMKTTMRPLVDLFFCWSRFDSCSKASNQLLACCSLCPYFLRAWWNTVNCSFLLPSIMPVTKKANWSLKWFRMRKVYPTRRRPYRATNSLWLLAAYWVNRPISCSRAMSFIRFISCFMAQSYVFFLRKTTATGLNCQKKSDFSPLVHLGQIK